MLLTKPQLEAMLKSNPRARREYEVLTFSFAETSLDLSLLSVRSKTRTERMKLVLRDLCKKAEEEHLTCVGLLSRKVFHDGYCRITQYTVLCKVK